MRDYGAVGKVTTTIVHLIFYLFPLRSHEKVHLWNDIVDKFSTLSMLRFLFLASKGFGLKKKVP